MTKYKYAFKGNSDTPDIPYTDRAKAMISDLVKWTGLSREHIKENYTETDYYFECAMEGRRNYIPK